MMNVAPIEAKLMAIYIGLIPVMDNNNTHNITIITNSIKDTKKIIESKVNPFQSLVILLATKIKMFFCKDRRNKIQFWFCPNKAEWPKHKLVDSQVKAAVDNPILPSKNSLLFSKKKECNNILREWQELFPASKKRGQLFLDFKDKKQSIIKPTYAKEGS